MSGNKLLADTNILLYFLKGNQDVVEMLTGNELVISFITELEMLAFPDINSESEDVIKGLLENCSIIEINPSIKHHTIEFRRNFQLKPPDAIIAATAAFYELPLLTADQQFKKVKYSTSYKALIKRQ